MTETGTTTLTRSPYDVLKVNRWSSDEQVKAHYYHLVKQYDPEHFEEEFIEIRGAYDILKDPAERAAIDVENFAPPPPFHYSQFPDFPDQPLSKFKLDQELKAVLGDRQPKDLKGDERGQMLRILRGVALYYAHNGNYEESADVVKKILELEPNDQETIANQVFFDWQRGYEFAMKGDYAAAEECFSKLMDQGVNPGIAYQNLALSQEKQGKKKEAEESWNQVVEHLKQELKSVPDDAYLKAFIIAVHKYTGGKFMDSSAHAAGGSAKDLGIACIRQGNWKQAVVSLEQAMRENSGDIDVLCQVGWAYLNTSQHAKAFQMWNTALKKSPGKKQILDHLVRGYLVFGKRLKDQRIHNQALVQFKNALQHEPENIEIRTELADTFFQMRNYFAAMQEFQKILDIDPRNKDARQGVREAKRLGGMR